MTTIRLAHGGGGRPARELLEFITGLLGPCLASTDEDSGVFTLTGTDWAMTTDSFIITPPFFPGGDIGKLSVCGTINDLVMVGAKPLYLTLALLLEEGFSLADLERVMESVRTEALRNGIKIVAGDTKVAARGELDGIFINTTGLGKRLCGERIGARHARPGDRVIITGSMGDHGGLIMALRHGFHPGRLSSDCAALTGLLPLAVKFDVHVMRDPTRGGVATVLNEIARASGVDILLWEEALPVKEEVKGVCEVLGLDPLYLACEGRALLVCAPEESARLLEELHRREEFAESREIGEVTGFSADPKVSLLTLTGGRRLLPLLVEEPTPRIC